MTKHPYGTLIGAVTAAALVTGSAAACTDIVTGSPDYRAETSDRIVKLDELADLLPDDAEAGAALGAPQLETIGTFDRVAPKGASTVVEQACEGAMEPARESVYRGYGYHAAYIRLALDESASGSQTLEDAVIAFGDIDESAAWVDRQIDAWRACTGRPLRVRSNDQDQYWVLTGPRLVHGVNVLLQQQEGNAGNACAHAITSAANIVIDLLPCSTDATAIEVQAADLANQIIARIEN